MNEPQMFNVLYIYKMKVSKNSISDPCVDLRFSSNTSTYSLCILVINSVIIFTSIQVCESVIIASFPGLLWSEGSYKQAHHYSSVPSG